MTRLDQTDREIIWLLNQDARLSSAEIGRRLELPERTVRNRINRLLRDEIIKPVGVLNPAKFGYHLAVDIFCELEMGAQKQVIEAVLPMREVTYLAYSTGDQDLSIQAIFTDSDEMHDFITRRLHTIPGIRRTRTVLVPRIVKETYEWRPPDEAFAGGHRAGLD
ncbi:MAG: Lrp/AsnC family transcriptional regulator [Chloroflexi bacterium]|nr:Lrp/AsnC family transcriptional regulator [Chloroflexota bacterium]